MSDDRSRITGEEHGNELEPGAHSSRRLSLRRAALLRFIERYLDGSLNAAQLQELADILECEFVEYEDDGDAGLIAQVLFEMSSPEANAKINHRSASRWKHILRGAEGSR